MTGGTPWEGDVRVDVYRSGIGQPCTVRMTHIPTGITVTRQDRHEAVARARATSALLAKTQDDLPPAQVTLARSQGHLRYGQQTLRVAQAALHPTEDDLDRTQGYLCQAQGALLLTKEWLGQTQGLLTADQDDLLRMEGRLALCQSALHSAQGTLVRSQQRLIPAQALLAIGQHDLPEAALITTQVDLTKADLDSVQETLTSTAATVEKMISDLIRS